MRPDVTRSILSEIDNAIAEHIDWLQRWHRAILCRLPPDRDVVSEDAHLMCRFGAWYEINGERGLIDQPAFQSLDQAHRALHDDGRWLAQKAGGGTKIEIRDYDLLVEKSSAFIERARRIVAAFRTALAELDPLTGVYNRQRMLSELERERERAVRTHGSCSIAIADLDHFKRVNDSHGHGTGDRVLFNAASCMVGHLRPYDTVFRFGGEEFLFCLPGADAATGAAVLNRLRKALAATPVEVDGGIKIAVTVSVGLAEMAADATVGEVIDRADEALYAAKRQGRNRVVTWRPTTPAVPHALAVANG
jgi:diguanylate cyclase (GGDEF)-like protein